MKAVAEPRPALRPMPPPPVPEAVRDAPPGRDLVLMLDDAGSVLRVAACGIPGLEDAAEAWPGRAWARSATPETRREVGALLEEAGEAGVSRPRRVLHEGRGRAPVPVAYTAVALARGARVMAVGRDLRGLSAIRQTLVESQQSLERESWQMRQTESRYRLLFRIAAEPLLVVDAETRRVVDANLAAARLFEVPAERLVGRPAGVGLERGSRPAMRELLATARRTGRAAEASARLAGSEGAIRLWATPIRLDGSTLLLLRARAVEPPEQGVDRLRLAELLEHMPDAVVLTDADGSVVKANRAFLELAQLVSEEHAIGRTLGEWVGGPESDLSMILAVVRHHGSIRVLPTSLRGEHGAPVEVELSAARVPGLEGPRLGFFLRPVARPRRPGPEAPSADLGGAVQALAERVGQVSLPELVRDTTELVEEHLIRAALELTGGNRTTAAEVLGLSRQSLYVKLRRRARRAGGPAGNDGILL